MRKTVTRTRQGEYEETVEVTCDLCGYKAPLPIAPWGQSSYEKLEVTVSIQVGATFPEGGHYDETYVDVCPECFRDIILPFLASKGVTPHTEHHSW